MQIVAPSSCQVTSSTYVFGAMATSETDGDGGHFEPDSVRRSELDDSCRSDFRMQSQGNKDSRARKRTDD